MAVTSTEFLERFPEFAPQPASTVTAALNQADRETGEDAWEDLHDDATYWLAAHQLAVRLREIGMFTGATPAKQYSGISTAKIPHVAAGLDSTLYGLEYQRLEQSRLPCSIGLVI